MRSKRALRSRRPRLACPVCSRVIAASLTDFDGFGHKLAPHVYSPGVRCRGLWAAAPTQGDR